MKGFLQLLARAVRSLKGSEAGNPHPGQADTLFSAMVAQGRIPGMAVTVFHEGRVCFEKGYGFANLEARKIVMPRQTLFRAASASKCIAAGALAKMVAQGIIDLDRSFYDYVPYYPRKGVDFTIGQLAGHTAGIRGYRGKEWALNKPYDIREGIEVFKMDPLLYPPGTQYFYNSYDWVLVSLAMQEASGISFAEYVKQQLLNPLGMFHTLEEPVGSDTASVAESPEMATFYTKSQGRFQKAVSVDNRYKLAAGGYLTTSRDLCLFGQAVLEERIAPEGIWSQFLTPQQINGSSTFYGLGWEVSADREGRRVYGHTGNGVGGYSNFYVYPAQKMVIAILINCTNPGVQAELDRARQSLITEVDVL